MEIFLSIIFICGVTIYFSSIDKKVSNHCLKYDIDWKKVNDDKTMFDLSEGEINRNILNGKYNK